MQPNYSIRIFIAHTVTLLPSPLRPPNPPPSLPTVGESKSHVRLSIEDGMLRGTIRTNDGKRVVVDPVVVTDRRPSAATGFRRRKGNVGAVARTACKVSLYADKLFYDAWGGSGSAAYKEAKVVAKMTSLLQSTDAVYSDPENFGQQLGLVVGSAEVVLDMSFSHQDGTSTTTAGLLSAFQEWLAAKVPKHDDQPCLHQLFTHAVLADRALGSSTLGMVDNGAYAGACSTVINHDHPKPRATNTGVISSLHGSGTVEYDVLLYTLVHELGHSFGAQHTCCLGESCPPGTSCAEMVGVSSCNPIGLKYVMHPELTITGDGSLLFSECSKTLVRDHVAQLSCLVPMHPCDNGGPCCDGPDLRPHGTVCRPANPMEQCSQAGFCTGVSHECPSSQPKAAGAVCELGATLLPPPAADSAFASAQSRPGVCNLIGNCEHPHTAFCKQKHSSDAVGCTLDDAPCTRACITRHAVGGPSGDCSATAGVEAYAGTPCFAPGSTHTNTLGLCLQGGVCKPLTTEAATGLAISHGLPADAQCAWSPSPWTACSRSCGRGVSKREFDCVCSSGSAREGASGTSRGLIVDVTGEACQATKPTDNTKTCNTVSCPECTSIELATTKMSDALAVELSGWYNRAGGEGTDYPEHMHGKAFFMMHHGGKEVFMYHVEAYGNGWWVIGPQLGSSYQWSAYIQSDADMPSMATDPWSTLGPEGVPYEPGGKRLAGSKMAIVVLEQNCVCDSASLVLDPVSRSQCVRADQLDERSSNSSSSANEARLFNNPVSTSTPHPEEGGLARTTRAPRQCPLYYAPAPTGTGCVRQYLCDNGISSAGGSCDCGEDNSCTRCHLSSAGTIRCLRRRQDDA